MTMSIELGFSAEYVFPTTNGLNGRSVEALKRTYEDITDDSVSVHPSMLSALAEIVSSAEANERRKLEELLGADEYLFGVSVKRAFDKVNEPYDALLFVRGSGLHKDAYRQVEVAKWARSYAEGARSDTSDALQFMIGVALGDVDDEKQTFRDRVWGVPVRRLTRVISLDGEPDYIHGQQKDREEIQKLKVSQELIDTLLLAAEQWHQKEVSPILTFEVEPPTEEDLAAHNKIVAQIHGEE